MSRGWNAERDLANKKTGFDDCNCHLFTGAFSFFIFKMHTSFSEEEAGRGATNIRKQRAFHHRHHHQHCEPLTLLSAKLFFDV